ncbi:MAG: hypothetical protein Hyperionvirus2_187 [Hyperionvirus sp.]|uniref:Uncharacterized protein n=1 Tax=Hyperionvirus sp. TaxID=2487770 RepID=A0A3G5AC01_9VIRU|nr:MAG: hypothetical protein Hyperionvirus2_187 [Hyperionvirus sp.]
MAKLASNARAVKLAAKYGLGVLNITWEDTGRDKYSSLGPNICDFTLSADSELMAMIRKPNYTDITCDTNIDNFNVTVGNEVKDPEKKLARISLRELLSNLPLYTNAKVKPMFLPRDEKILTSAQACILPAQKDGSVEFNPEIASYQSTAGNPAVLVIVVSSNGTSIQVLTDWRQKLYFNDGGMAANFKAQGLTAHRKSKGVTDEAELKKDLSVHEKQDNMLLVFQIPLKQKELYAARYKSLYKSNGIVNECASVSGASMFGLANFEDAILTTGKAHSVFKGTQDLELERDERFPIRVVEQFYKISNTLEIEEKEFALIAEKINNVYLRGGGSGSLVVDGVTPRMTEPGLQKTLSAAAAAEKPLVLS